MKTKIIPFDIKMAKDIQNGKIKGKIVRNGREVTILNYNSKQYKYLGYPIRFVYLDEDEIDYAAPEGLHIEVLDNEPQFKPFDKVLVRDNSESKWVPDIFRYYDDNYPKDYPYRCCANDYKYCIPYEGNEHLVGTTDNPKDE